MLIKHSLVRREWRLEAESWLQVTDGAVLLEEAKVGLWGGTAAKLALVGDPTRPAC